MKEFAKRRAVVTGGGTGIGRALVRQLAATGADVAMCDVNADNMAESRRLALETAADGVRVETFVADVGDPAAMDAFGAFVAEAFDTDAVELVINNAGIGGGGSFVAGGRAEWERTFNTCWGGVYNGCRTFVPMLVTADEGHLVNVSSVNGFWASIGPQTEHTAYSAAKFAVKGFTEALITDLRLNAPHVGVSVVMPGHIGTDIVLNSAVLQGHSPDTMGQDDLAEVRRTAERRGIDTSEISDDQLRDFVRMQGEMFRDSAPTTPEQAATIILDGVRYGRWRILVGDDAAVLDQHVRAEPESAYELDFMKRQVDDGGMALPL